MFKYLWALLNIPAVLHDYKVLSTERKKANPTLADLYALGKKIYKLKFLDLLSRPNYYPISFSTQTGNIPQTYGGLNLPVELTSVKKLIPPYIQGTVFLKGRYLGVTDLDGNDIYEASNGVLFIYLYKPPDPLTGIDHGLFTIPRLDSPDYRSNDDVFRVSAQLLVDQLPQLENDEVFKLTLTNRITELQRIAYFQGVSKDKLLSNLTSKSNSEESPEEDCSQA